MLSDELWARIEPLHPLLKAPADGGLREHADVVEVTGMLDPSRRTHRALLRERGITAVITDRPDQQGHRHHRGSAGGRPDCYNTERCKDRNVTERSYEKLKQWRGLATPCDKLTVIFRGGAILRSINLWLRGPIGDTP